MVFALTKQIRFPIHNYLFKCPLFPQNFSAIAYQKTVKSKQEATVAYSFMPADAFAGRPIGLSINLAYRDAEGNFYFDPVFNETVQIVEFDEGFDTEVFFMWVFLVAGVLLVLFLGFTMLAGEFLGRRVFFCHKSALSHFSLLG